MKKNQGNGIIANVSHSDSGSYIRMQEDLHDDINEALSKRAFDNEELQLILSVIQNVDSFKRVFSIMNSCG